MFRPASPPKTGDDPTDGGADPEQIAQPSSGREGRARPVWLERVVLPADLHVPAAPRPDPAAREIAIALRAVGVNLDVPGCELSGVVTRGGGGFRVGDPVMGVTDHAGGGRAGASDHGAGQGDLVAPAARFVKLPAGWSFEQGAAFPVSYLHAHELLCVRGGAGPGSRVLVQGALGPVRQAALQIARALGCQLVGRPGAGVDLVVDLGRPIDLAGLLADPAGVRERFERILALGDLTPVVGALFPLEELRAARAYLESGRSAGKVVVTVDEP